jgi:hypothetical protein
MQDLLRKGTLPLWKKVQIRSWTPLTRDCIGKRLLPHKEMPWVLGGGLLPLRSEMSVRTSAEGVGKQSCTAGSELYCRKTTDSRRQTFR